MSISRTPPQWVSNRTVKLHRRLLVLPLLGLLLFGVWSYGSYRFNQHIGIPKYYWWASIRLDRDPLNQHPAAIPSCNPGDTDCWEPTSVWVDPGSLAKVLMTSALPAFLLGRTLAHAIGQLGISEVTTFMISVPILMFAWYYFLSWLGFGIIARLRRRRRARTAH
jgi:hypothetical protein